MLDLNCLKKCKFNVDNRKNQWYNQFRCRAEEPVTKDFEKSRKKFKKAVDSRKRL